MKVNGVRGLVCAACCLLLSATAGMAAFPGELWDATVLAQPGERQSLDGTWDFRQETRLDRIPDFAGATRVRVPGHRAPGTYRRVFEFAPRMSASRRILHFGAVGYRCVVFLNGERVGGHLGGFTPFEFDVTDALREGTNELVVAVQGREGTRLNPEVDEPVSVEEGFTLTGVAQPGEGGRSVIGYGYFAFEGIRHGVHLREVPPARIADAAFMPSYRNGRLDTRVRLANAFPVPREAVLHLEVFSFDIPSGSIAAEPAWEASDPVKLEPGWGEFRFSHRWADPALWMPGDPHLYVGRHTLEDAATGEVLHRRDTRFGFREVWTEGPRIVVNGVPFRAFVHGMLDSQAAPGRVRELFSELLDYNINMVRPSTMPPPPHFALLADEMGIGLVGESELTFNRSHAYEQPAFWDNFERTWQARIARDKNHPSILLWSLANEVMLTSPGVQGLGRKFYETFLALREIDPTRPFMQEGDGDLRDHRPDGTGFPIDIINMHFYDVSPTKNPLWATEFPPVAWALEDVTDVTGIPGTIKYGIGMPDRGRPWFVGEFGPAVLIAYPDHFAFWTGPSAYRDLFGQAEGVVRAVGETMALQMHGFRDLDMAGMDPWGATPLAWLKPYLKPAMSPVLLFTRDSTGHWFGGGTAARRFSVLNDSRSRKALHIEARLRAGDTVLIRRSQRIEIGPGERHDGEWSFPLPTTGVRRSLRLEASVRSEAGEELSGFSQEWSVFPRIRPSAEWTGGRVLLAGDADRLGGIAAWSGRPVLRRAALPEPDLRRHDLVVMDGASFHSLPAGRRSNLDEYVEQGGVLLLLDADRVSMPDLPELRANSLSDSTRVFMQGSHPLTAGTTDSDWEFWHPDHYVSRGNYAAPVGRGAEVPLIAGGAGGLRYSPLVVLRRGAGAVAASRLQVGRAIGDAPVAALFLNNAARYAAQLRVERERGPGRRLALALPEPGRGAEVRRLAEFGIDVEATAEDAFRDPTGHVLLAGGAAGVDIARVRAFLERGGTLWLRRLEPGTPWLEAATGLAGPFALRAPRMWLQQFEIAQPGHPLLDGISDVHTCWATFAWTHGDRYSLRTRPIAGQVLTGITGAATILLAEPDWTGEWDSGPGKSTLAQELLYKVGQHRRNEDPGAGLVLVPAGRGRILIDQLHWDEAIGEDAVAIPDKARHFLLRLWGNLQRD